MQTSGLDGVAWIEGEHTARGAYAPLRRYGVDHRVTSVMIEIRRDQYLSEPNDPLDDGWSRTVDELATVLPRPGTGPAEWRL